MTNNFLLCFLIVSIFWMNDAVATVFAGDRDGPRVEIKDADFLETIGVVATTNRVSNQPNSELRVSFTSSQIPSYADIFVEILLVDPENKLLFAVETPFVNTDHTVSYIVPDGYSIFLSIAMPVSENTKYYKVTFRNSLKNP